MSKECSIVSDLLPLYSENMLKPETKEFVEEHLHSCPVCRKELEEMNAPCKIEDTVNSQISREHAQFKSIQKKWYSQIALLIGYFFPPVISFTLYTLIAVTAGFNSLNPLVWCFTALLLVSAILLMRKKWWGCIGGLVTGIVLIYMGTQYTGQVINETPIGIAFCIYYVMLGIFCFRDKRVSQ